MRHAIPIGILWVALSVHAHGADIGTPRLGYVWDSAAQSVRPVEGIPGAAFLGQALDLGGQLTRAVICRNLGYILAISSRERTASVLQIGAGSVTSRVIEGARQPVDRMVLSPSGTSALLYDAREQTLQIVTGLPGTPVVTRSITVPAAEAMSVSDDGLLVLLALGESLDPAFLSGSSEMPSSIPISGPVSAMALRPHSHDALIATAGSITWVPSLDTDPSYEVVDGDPNTPAALSFSDDGSRFFAAYTDGRVRVRSLVSGAASVSACPCVPDRLQPLHGDSLFALNQPGQGPLFIYDGVNNRVVFVGRGDQ
jgi:hypothetical protein